MTQLIPLYEANGEVRQYINLSAIELVYSSTASSWDEGTKTWVAVPTTVVRMPGSSGDRESYEPLESFVRRLTADKVNGSPAKKLKTLDEVRARVNNVYEKLETPRPNGIECPKCKAELNDANDGMMLASYPPQYNVVCPSCGYYGTRY